MAARGSGQAASRQALLAFPLSVRSSLLCRTRFCPDRSLPGAGPGVAMGERSGRRTLALLPALSKGNRLPVACIVTD